MSQTVFPLIVSCLIVLYRIDSLTQIFDTAVERERVTSRKEEREGVTSRKEEREGGGCGEKKNIKAEPELS